MSAEERIVSYRFEHQIHRCLINGHRIGAREDPEIRSHRRPVHAPAIAVRQNLLDERDEQSRTAVQGCFRVFRNFSCEDLHGGLVSGNHGPEGAHGHALSAA